MSGELIIASGATSRRGHAATSTDGIQQAAEIPGGRMLYTLHASPIGRLLLVSDGAALVRIVFDAGDDGFDIDPAWTPSPAPFVAAARQLDEYFAGTRREFDLPLAPAGTAFQLRVWDALRTIPYGRTWSYLALARAVGNERAVRAVGLANGRNPLPIVIPCHRVIGADGSLVGFGGGLPRKSFLLQLERRGEEFALRP